MHPSAGAKPRLTCASYRCSIKPFASICQRPLSFAASVQEPPAYFMMSSTQRLHGRPTFLFGVTRNHGVQDSSRVLHRWSFRFAVSPARFHLSSRCFTTQSDTACSVARASQRESSSRSKKRTARTALQQTQTVSSVT